MLAILIGATLAAAAPQTAPPSQPPAASQFWRIGSGRAIFTPARISVPADPGAVRLDSTREFSHPGSSLDSAALYQSPDGAVFATVYVYYPGLPHAGLASVATDWALHSQSPEVRQLGLRAVSAAGTDNAAIRIDYAGYRDGLASSAAFLKAGRWIVKVRVSGPEARRAEIEATMAAILADMRFEGDLQPRLATPLALADCASDGRPAAHLLPEDGTRVLAQAMLATFDGSGEPARNEQGRAVDPLPGRVGPAWCRAMIGREPTRMILRAPSDDGGEAVEGRSVMLVPVNDAGVTAELVRMAADQYVLLYHQIGSTAVLGTYDAPLSDGQIMDILSGADRDGGRFRANVELRTDGDTNITIGTSAPARREDGQPVVSSR